MKNPNEFTILIVDDEVELRNLLEELFTMDGYNVLKANSGNEALEIVKSHNVDFVISDVRMPNGNGIDLLTGIRQINLEKPVVLLASGFSEFSKAEALEKGALDLLIKPVDFDTVEEYVRNCQKNSD